MDYNPSFPMDPNGPVSAPSVSMPKDMEQERINAPDFIMNAKRAEARKANPPRIAGPKNDNWMPARIITEDVEFRPHKEQEKLMSGRKARIGDLTKQILTMHFDAMKKFRRAEKYLSRISKDEEENPTEKIIRARKIVAKGPPITKAEAQEQAYEQLVKFGW